MTRPSRTLRAAIAEADAAERAARREAQAKHRASLTPAPSRVRWDKRPGPDPDPEALSAEAARRARLDAEFARRAPAAAAAERRLAQRAAAIEEAYGHKAGGTAATFAAHEGRAGGALARLYRSEAITAEQLAAAHDIAQVAEGIARGVSVRTASLETRVDGTRFGGAHARERLNAMRREAAYSSWRAEVATLGPVGAVLDCVIGETTAVTIVAKRYRMHVRRAKRLLVAALDLWPAHCRAAWRRIDDRDLAIAEALLAL